MKNVLPNDSSTFPWLLQFNWALWSFIAIVLYTLHAYSTGAFGTNKNYCVKQDEPTTGMDAGTRRLAWKCITAATQRGQAVVLTSHRWAHVLFGMTLCASVVRKTFWWDERYLQLSVMIPKGGTSSSFFWIIKVDRICTFSECLSWVYKSWKRLILHWYLWTGTYINPDTHLDNWKIVFCRL